MIFLSFIFQKSNKILNSTSLTINEISRKIMLFRVMIKLFVEFLGAGLGGVTVCLCYMDTVYDQGEHIEELTGEVDHK